MNERVAVTIRRVVLSRRRPSIMPSEGVMTSLLFLAEDDKGGVLVALVNHLQAVRGGR